MTEETHRCQRSMAALTDAVSSELPAVTAGFHVDSALFQERHEWPFIINVIEGMCTVCAAYSYGFLFCLPLYVQTEAACYLSVFIFHQRLLQHISIKPSNFSAARKRLPKNFFKPHFSVSDSEIMGAVTKGKGKPRNEVTACPPLAERRRNRAVISETSSPRSTSGDSDSWK